MQRLPAARDETAQRRAVPPRVTVWLSCYNHAPYLRRAVDSILAQTFQDYVVYAVDDCSQDDSWPILQEYAQRLPGRFLPFRHRRNRGGSHMEDLLEQLPGEYIAIAHSDDAWAPRKLEKQVEYLDAHPDAGACFTAVQFIDDSGLPLAAQEVAYEPFLPEHHSPAGWLRRLTLQGNCLCHPSALVRKPLYRLPGALARGLYSLPDYHRWLVLAAQGQGMAVLPEPLTYFRLHADGSNMSADTPAVRRRIAGEELLAAQALFDLEDTALLRRAFPEAEPWLPRRGPVGEDGRTFALAKALLALECPAGFRAEAARRLYGLLNRPAAAAWLQRRFGYDDLAFQEDLARADLFGTGRRQQLAEQLAAAQAGLAQQAARAAAAEQALQAVLQSRCWRATAPLRAAAGRLRRPRGR